MITLEYKAVVKTKKQYPYTVHINFEHGDADTDTSVKVTLKEEAELLKFIETYDLICKELSDSSGELSSTSLTRLENLPYADWLLVPDVMYTSGDNYATPWIEEIEYVDEAGSKFEVQIKRTRL